MKKLVFITLLLVAVGAAWGGRVAWRAHKNLVTLNVRNAPLADVIRSIERQTRETIHLDKRLEGTVTLKLKNAPLAEALDRVAEEVGARAQTLHAVHRSDFALKQLKTALRDGGRIGSVGWTNLAPRQGLGGSLGNLKLDDFAQLPAGATAITSGPVTLNMSGSGLSGGAVEEEVRKQLSAQGLDKLIPEGAIAGALQQAMTNSNGTVIAGSPRVRVMTLGPDGQLKTSEGSELSPEVREALAGATNGSHSGWVSAGARRAPMVTVKRAGPNGTLETVETDFLSPERIVVESALDEQFPAAPPANPSRESAEAAALRVKGRCTTFYALQHSDLPIMIGRTLKGLPERTMSSLTNGTPLEPAAMADQLAKELQREKAEQYQTLTPEQRARRARELRPLAAP